ncbi:type I glyceraldehyde-3-phosphate dehydrogenase [Roseovarius rhodophyticola]|uniref:Glyceraldehyde 3-phosphate dehydrogenase NAD-binding domain-containing protein n=1 Tax=Roseovarius rhodophyticola TaxID=3080827 RepID=A0ABZ2TC48_9RHOB|nr:glyceraldehyde 3-phosphate dehydrogenase NAD-binding domain-containing protein [Roseovarius sp. W115]MDV2930984.1 glyceraldehyde 3-phosphate dehydrogenase NAD-binding domain-containing protein [Roseovarius sp. W115]
MSTRPIRVAINGFGRIGRTLLRILLRDAADFELLCINEIEPLSTCAYLFQYDSVFGPWPEPVNGENGILKIGGRHIPFYSEPDLSALDLSAVDVVLECTGMGGTRAVAERGLVAGATKVLVSGPSAEVDVTSVLGANEAQIGDHRIVSNASCTTNALAPLARLLDEAFGLVSGQMTTVHCYTGSQPTVDKPRAAPERSRAAAMSMVPTTTSAQHQTGLVLPHLQGRIEARAIRVPTASVSCIDLTVQTNTPVNAASANAVLQNAVRPGGVFGWTEQPLVSADLRMRPESVVMVGPETSVSTGGLLRVFGWYDNEWGFSCRMLDMARLMAA